MGQLLKFLKTTILGFVACSVAPNVRAAESEASLALKKIPVACMKEAFESAREKWVVEAKAAGDRFHAACDEWAAARAAGKSTGRAGDMARSTMFTLESALYQTKYDLNNVVMFTRQQAAFGSYRTPRGSNCSYLVGTGQTGLIVAAWSREPWPPGMYPGKGINFGIGIEPYELQPEFVIGTGRWDEKGEVLSVPYILVDQLGTFELHLKNGEWSFHPDRGELKGGWWNPLKKKAAEKLPE